MKKERFIHVMSREKFTDGIVDFYNTYFQNGAHVICYLRHKEEESLIHDGVGIRQTEVLLSGNRMRDAVKVLWNLKDFDFIVLHSLFVLTGGMQLLFLLCPGVMKKIVWIEWGGDLYTWNMKGPGIKRLYMIPLGLAIRKRIGSFVGIFPPDCEEYLRQFPASRANVFYAPYCSAKGHLAYQDYSSDRRLSRTRKEKDTVYIQIGHNAMRSLNHIETMRMLQHLAGEDIKLFLPLSYGDEENAREVEEYAREHFPGKTICLRSFMPKDEYFELLDRIDIAIFQTYRQCGLGNIYQMIFRNVKLFMPEKSVMYKYFVSQGIPIQKSDTLSEISFGQLCSDYRITDSCGHKKMIESLGSVEEKVELWRKIYDNLSAEE